MTGYKSVSSQVVPEVQEVRLYDETLTHIKGEHGEIPWELPCMVGAILNATVTPTVVESHRPKSFVYVDGNTTNLSGHSLRVAVKSVAPSSARISTAYFSSDERNVIWRRPDDDD